MGKVIDFPLKDNAWVCPPVRMNDNAPLANVPMSSWAWPKEFYDMERKVEIDIALGDILIDFATQWDTHDPINAILIAQAYIERIKDVMEKFNGRD